MDTGSKNLLNIFITFGIFASRYIRMLKFINKNNRWLALQNGVNIHLCNFYPSIHLFFTGDKLKLRKQGCELPSFMSLNKTSYNINTVFMETFRFLKHPKGFANP